MPSPLKARGRINGRPNPPLAAEGRVGDIRMRRGASGMDQQLIETIADGVATLTLNRPDRLNALSAPIMDGLLEALPRLARDATVGAVVLTGAGRAFCAGGDVKRMAAEEVARSGEAAVALLRSRMEISRL